MLLLLLAFGLFGFGASVSPTVTKTATPTPTQTPPSVVYQTPAPPPTPVGSLIVATAIITHGQPIKFTEAEPNAQVLVNGNFVVNTNASGVFFITFPAAGTYTINVGDYPQQTLVVN